MFERSRGRACSSVQLRIAVLGEDQPPRVHAHEVARPQRHQHRHEQRAPAAASGRSARRRTRTAARAARRSPSPPPRSRSCAARSCGTSATSTSVLKLSSFQLWTSLPRERVDAPERRDEQRRRAPRGRSARTTRRGADSSSPPRSHGRRNSAADTRMRRRRSQPAKPARRAGSAAARALPGYFRPLLLPRRVVRAVVLAVAAFVDRRLPELDRCRSTPPARWRGTCAHEPFSIFSMYAQAFVLAGVSPNEIACCGLHFRASTPSSPTCRRSSGASACADSIHVSAQPVAPSLGISSLTGSLSACSVLVW